jgi:MFS superfamily sulfate permease-like transporter
MSNPNKGIFGISLSHIKEDLPAGLVVFLVALPLCLGIALASGVPLFAGLIAGFVGGTVVALFSNSQTSVSGPAAGLVVIVLNALDDLGTFESFLLAVVLAGVFQLIFGIMKAGTVGNYFPTSVIKGMLAAIGIILILKEIPHALGYDSDYIGDDAFIQQDGDNTFTAILHSFKALSLGAILISSISIFILIYWEKIQHPLRKVVPGALVVVFLGVMINAIYLAFFPSLYLGPEHLVAIPSTSEVGGFLNLFTTPDFSDISNPTVYKVALTLAIVASLETLLNIEAVDKLDAFKRRTSANRELTAQGIGNVISGLIGGLPVTAVIVRGAANVSAGARTKLSAIIHGVLLFAAVISIPGLLSKIPYASLAAILLLIGYKLTKVSLYKEMFNSGRDQFVPFMVTILAIVFKDLLFGVLVGLGVAIFYILRVNMKNTYSFDKGHQDPNAPIKLILSDEVTFLNKASMRLTLDHIPEGSEVIIDGSKSVFIHYDVLEIIHEFADTAHLKGIKVKLVNIKESYTKPTLGKYH